MNVQPISVEKINSNENRAYGGEGEIGILAEDMKKNGLINAITVRETANAKLAGYDIVAGRRRLAAAKLLGWKQIDANILGADEKQSVEDIAGSENINRLAMHPLDEAEIFKRLIESGQTIEELSKRYDRKTSAIWQRIQLLDLNEDIKALFRNGHLSLQSAAMLKSLDAEAQKAFRKEFQKAFKMNWFVEGRFVKQFIFSLGHDKLYGFLRDKQCAECKTRTYFTDKNLFPEMDETDENCFNHECYLQKWEKVLAGRIKSLKGEHKTHAQACLIVSIDEQFRKIVGNKTTIDGAEYKVLPYDYYTNATAKDKGAQPCFNINVSHSGKLEIDREYWKEKEKQSNRYGDGMSTSQKRKQLSPVIDILDLPKPERDIALEAMSNSKRISPYGFGNNVRESVYWKIIDIKAEEFTNPETVNHNYKELFLKKYFSNLGSANKRIFEKFTGNISIPVLAELDSDKIFALLLAMEWNSYDIPDPEDYAKGKQGKEDVMKWVNLAPEKVKKIYQEEISRRIPKAKPEVTKPAEKKPKGPKATKTKPAAKKAAKEKKSSSEKTTECDLCKAAHPDCPDCCATCKDTCNGNQICRKTKIRRG